MKSRVAAGDTASRAPEGSAGKGFFSSLESLRGLAAMVVVILHAVWTNPVSNLRIFQNGALMVDLFFVLSGFVICHSYGARLGTSADIGRFLWLRLGRLYPLHLAFLFVFLGFEVSKLIAQQRFGVVADKPAFGVNNGFAFLTNLFLLQSLGLHHSLTFNYPSWSISTEFYTYGLFAVVRSVTGRAVGYLIAAVVVIVVSMAVLDLAHVVSIADAGFDWGFFRCCWGFFLGTLIWHLFEYLKRHPVRPQYIMILSWLSPLTLAAALIFLACVDPDSHWTYAFPWLAALIVLTVVAWPHAGSQKVLESAALQWLGRVSYSLYMVHAAIVWIFVQVLTMVFKFPKIVVEDGHGVGTPAAVGIGVLLVYVVAVLCLSQWTYTHIEEPFRRRAKAVAASAFVGPRLIGDSESHPVETAGR
ncbi:MAG TPA: acyltransferase [Steroidobacteraceae bacterium]|nr:acyltransferase [Steroidobacteraceae bacterium]